MTSSRLSSGLRATLLAALGLAAVACADRSGEERREAPAGPQAAPSGTTSSFPSPGAARGANLLLVTLDTTRADRVGCGGDGRASTPNLDRLAGRGVCFRQAVSPVPMTLPAHASLLTGLDPPAHGVRVNGEAALADEHRTLAEALAAGGYRTAAFVSSFVLDERYGLAQGFAVYDARLETSRAAALEPQTERSARAVTEAALAWLRDPADGEDAPFFLWIHYFDPHDPYEPPEPFASRFRDRPYDGEIAYVDAELGRLLDALPPDTLVAVAGDHGESLGEHGERFHSRTLYEGAVRVPLILARPRSARATGEGAVSDRLATLPDLYPTLLDLLGVDAEAGARPLDGISLARPAPAAEDRAVYLETLNPYHDNGWAPLYGARSRERKYVRAPRPELYDLATDPREEHNLLAGGAAAPRAAERLRALIARKVPEAEADLAALETGAPVDPAVRRRLEALGYLTPGGGARPAAGEPLPDPKDMLPLLEEIAAGRSALAGGRPNDAERSARRVLTEAPRDRSALQLLAESYAVRGRVEAAERTLRRSVEIGPTVGALVLLAQVVMQQRRSEEAEALLAGAAELDPRHGAVLLARGDLALVQGRSEEAVALYREAADADPYRFAGLARARIARVEGQR